MSGVDDQPFLEPRHLADFRDAVRGLNITAARLEVTIGRGIRELLAALQQIATNTEGLPALVEALRLRANGGQSVAQAATLLTEEP